MVKNNTRKPITENEEIDIFAQIHEEDSSGILITSEESITITLFDDEPLAEPTEDEDDFETNIFPNKKKVIADDEDSDFDSYFFEE